MFRFDHVDTQVLQGLEGVAAVHAFQNLLGVLFPLHLHERTLAGLGPPLSPVVLLVLVVVAVVATFVHVHRQADQRVVGCAAVLAAELAGTGEHGSVELVVLPVELHGAEEARLGEEMVWRLLQGLCQCGLVPIVGHTSTIVSTVGANAIAAV